MMSHGLIDLTSASGLDIRLDPERLALEFGPGIGYPPAEIRRLAQTRLMLKDGVADGPDHLYTIYMDIYRHEDRELLHDQRLLYGAVVYNHGTMGRERLRSQGHVHSEKPGVGLRYSELYEFWTGHGYVFLQKESTPVVTRAYLVRVKAGDRLVVPFGWAHLVVTEGDDVLSFGAWCARDNRLEYGQLRALRGPCWYFLADGALEANPRYTQAPPVCRITAGDLPSLGIPRDQPIYTSWRAHPRLFEFMANPEKVGDVWADL
jgi:glucose-6-phosphate isomerase